MPVSAVAELLGEEDTRLWRVVQHYVEVAAARESWAGVRRICVDETSARRGHRYVMGALPFCHCLYQSKIQKVGFPVEVKPVGDAIRKRRLELGLRQVDAAKLFGCDKMTMTNWEKNYTRPRITHMAGVVRFLGYDPTPPCVTMAQRLLNYRTARGTTQKDFASQLGVDPSTLARWERGEREPAGRFKRLAEMMLARRP